MTDPVNTLLLIQLFLSVLIAVIVRISLSEENKIYALFISPVLIILLAVGFKFMIPKTEPYTHPARAPQSVADEVSIDIVDSRTDKTKVQIIIYYKNCVDRIELKKNELDNLEKLNKAVDKIMTLRDKTGGC